jgi:large subunit ribosomal protein L13
MSTYFPKETTPEWVIVDAAGQTVGRLATQLASVLRGKHKPDFTPNQTGGDFVIVVNAEKVALTGQKLAKKVAYRHSGQPGGLKAVGYEEMLDRYPVRTVEKAIRGSYPKPKMIVLGFPSNPTAQCVELDFFERVVALAKKHDIFVVHDLAYADIVFDGWKAVWDLVEDVNLAIENGVRLSLYIGLRKAGPPQATDQQRADCSAAGHQHLLAQHAAGALDGVQAHRQGLGQRRL